tara:strand:- start:4 stop:462 length:459 start_codon:yes stop_codon:yes gene_type:complete
MINKKLFTLVAFLFLLNCGYQPIFSSNQSIFSISSIELTENNNVNSKLRNALSIYTKNQNTQKFYDLKISSKISKSILSKDSKGDPKILSLGLSIKISVIENNYLKNERTFLKTVSYDNNNNKFELKQYENKIASNLTNKIIEEVIIHLQSL